MSATFRKLQAKLSGKIHSIIDTIDALDGLMNTHDNLDFKTQISILEEERNALIVTQNYLEKCEFKLSNTIQRWLDNDCKGKIQISLTGKKNEH